ncbi:OV-16 antigen [Escovopsis weberi]|uniref:OV-16 antigen n=1 Tax=Escovopsis weberi TaxID=150374 RepID=A0A0M8N584_ESCWE|nr:OV-16 antigen [Escovopsis weberi]
MADLAQEMAASLAAAGLVPGSAESVIPASFFAAGRPVAVRVSFGGRAVELGNLFRAGECKTQPDVELAFPEGGEEEEQRGHEAARYVFMMVDPDAPTPDEPQYAFWRHWVVAGEGRGFLGEGAASVSVTRYLGPGPKDESKPHRYLFLLFERQQGQEQGQEVEELLEGSAGGEEFVQRRSFDVAGFAGRHGLRLAGMNWMRCVGDGWTA